MARTFHFFIFFIIKTACFAQQEGKTITRKEWNAIGVQECRQSFSNETKTILNGLDSLLVIDSTLEFRTVGEASRLSGKFAKYAQLVTIASEAELLEIISCKSELPEMRGYAYMAYAFKCSIEKKKENPLNYNFSLHTLKGCLGFTMSFSKFKSYCKERDGFDPNPRKTVINPEEKKAIKEENKIRLEQGVPKRKE